MTRTHTRISCWACCWCPLKGCPGGQCGWWWCKWCVWGGVDRDVADNSGCASGWCCWASWDIVVGGMILEGSVPASVRVVIVIKEGGGRWSMGEGTELIRWACLDWGVELQLIPSGWSWKENVCTLFVKKILYKKIKTMDVELKEYNNIRKNNS